jgi:hypothetical protein
MCDDQRRIASAITYYLDHALSAEDPERSAYERLRDGADNSPREAIARLIEEVKQAGLSEIDLDELVHDCDRRPSQVNNAGLDAQVGFIVEMLGVPAAESELRKLIGGHTPAPADAAAGGTS